MATDPLAPSPTLLCKIGSIAVHTDEFLSPYGHPYDKAAIEDLLKDPEVVEWLTAMRHCALVPEKRNA
jgi:hypothetical protein